MRIYVKEKSIPSIKTNFFFLYMILPIKNSWYELISSYD